MEGFINSVTSINSTINSLVWGVPMLVLIISTGIYMTVRTKFFQVRRAKHVNDETFKAIFTKKSVTKSKDEKSISQFQALSTALAATIGTGNIAGVATAITVGGAGAVFWMWISAFFGMMTNFSENVLGIYYRKKNKKGEWSGGPMYYLENGLKDKKGLHGFSKPLAVIFALFCMLASFGIGNMTQVNSIASALEGSFGVPPLATGLVVAAVASLVIVGGIKRIGQVTERIVPFMALAYILGSVVIMIVNAAMIPEVFGEIFTKAFGFDAVAGGISGAMVRQAITMGFKRGVFSNEAGLGSSVMVHSSSDVKEPVIQGMWGIFEVFFDTIIVCTLTAFVILSTGALETGESGVPLVSAAFTHGFGGFAGEFVSLAILLFAFSTILGWSFYGTKAAEYLFGSGFTIVYKVLFIIFIVIGATMSLDLVWNISDTLNGLMAIPNLIGVLLLSNTVLRITADYVDRNIRKKKGTEAPLLSAYEDLNREQAKDLVS
ncbi:alanine:cation symporter family protein [Alkalibacter rhizosphaerae]|uniref:Alanine:cation symporter family protein n=1 Tax=Alkalibacter rhizosphaerae TaxID=2815577 RepID=A0A975AJA7_9FIRM|nr:sodium:alanine symporter family protein [Alkalibacter rhizosphaerae]QSX09400.1 alanine:cation symporter family protein [Alkalibacter rhizosphaerae]